MASNTDFDFDNSNKSDKTAIFIFVGFFIFSIISVTFILLNNKKTRNRVNANVGFNNRVKKYTTAGLTPNNAVKEALGNRRHAQSLLQRRFR
jgi:hypothetical protein